MAETGEGERVLVLGVKVASQTPAIRSGQRIVFLTLDDATFAETPLASRCSR